LCSVNHVTTVQRRHEERGHGREIRAISHGIKGARERQGEKESIAFSRNLPRGRFDFCADETTSNVVEGGYGGELSGTDPPSHNGSALISRRGGKR